MKFLVLGASGMLGASLVPALAAAGHQVTGHGRVGAHLERAELTDAMQSQALLERIAPDVTVNLCGLTDVDRCEAQPQLAWLGNVRTAENVAAACAVTGSHLVHVSTDQVYDGELPQTEEQARPGNTYALSKYAGELAVLAWPGTVLRTNFFGASRHPVRRSLTDWLFDEISAGRPVKVFEDVWFSPLSIDTLCGMIERVAAARPNGIFNLGSREGMSKADFAFAFAKALSLPVQGMTRVKVRDAGTAKAWRPAGMQMDCARLELALGLALPRLEDEIESAAKDYCAEV